MKLQLIINWTQDLVKTGAFEWEENTEEADDHHSQAQGIVIDLRHPMHRVSNNMARYK